MKQIKDKLGTYSKQISKYPLLSKEEEIKLTKEYKKGNYKAREKLITSNLRLVISIANRYKDRGLLIDDLIEEGNLGLMKAVERFDETKGFKFSTYAVWWIHQTISRALQEKIRDIKIPVYLQEIINSTIRNTKKLQEKNKKIPTLDEISKSSGISIHNIKRGLEAYRVCTTVSLSDPIFNDINYKKIFPFESTIYIKNSCNYLDKKKLLNKISIKLDEFVNRKEDNISKRDKDIYIMRIGMGVNEINDLETLQIVADKYNLSRERIRQIVYSVNNKIKEDKELKKIYKDIKLN
jgi:RNA polymerase primary sigma factor